MKQRVRQEKEQTRIDVEIIKSLDEPGAAKAGDIISLPIGVGHYFVRRGYAKHAGGKLSSLPRSVNSTQVKDGTWALG